MVGAGDFIALLFCKGRRGEVVTMWLFSGAFNE
jgi:hypothetical protein